MIKELQFHKDPGVDFQGVDVVAPERKVGALDNAGRPALFYGDCIPPVKTGGYSYPTPPG